MYFLLKKQEASFRVVPFHGVIIILGEFFTFLYEQKWNFVNEISAKKCRFCLSIFLSFFKNKKNLCKIIHGLIYWISILLSSDMSGRITCVDVYVKGQNGTDELFYSLTINRKFVTIPVWVSSILLYIALLISSSMLLFVGLRKSYQILSMSQKL